MADIVEERSIIQQEETAPQAAVSESTMTRVGANINFINLRQLDQVDFKLNGPYNLITPPQVHLDGIITFPFAFEISAIAISNGTNNGSSGTTELDVKWQPYDNSSAYSSIFSTTPKFTPSSAPQDLCFNGDSKTGFTAPVLSKTTFASKDKLRVDLLQAISGTVDGAGIKIFWRPI